MSAATRSRFGRIVQPRGRAACCARVAIALPGAPKLSALVAIAAIAAATLAPPRVRGALPVFHGGTVRLEAPSPIRTLDPAQVDDPLEAALAHAATDGLYATTRDGAVLPLLAMGPPVVEGARARIEIRTDVARVGGRNLTAESILTSLVTAARERRARVFLEAFYDDHGRPRMSVVDPTHIELALARPDLDPARILAARPLAIANGRDRRSRPIATGPFAARREPTGAVRLAMNRAAPRGSPFLAELRFAPPRDRDAALRAFELGALDGSFFGESLYGGTPVRPALGGERETRVSVLLVPNRAHGALESAGAWGAVARAIDRGRLARTGIAPRDTLADGLPPPAREAAARPSTLPPLRLAVETGDAAAARVADALAAMLDEAGITVRVTQVPPDRYAQLVSTTGWDLRLAYVSPPYEDDRGLVLAAMAETGQMTDARALLLERGLDDPSVEARHAPRLDALVLGRYRASFHARADLVGRVFDGRALPALEALHYRRETVATPAAADDDAEEGPQ